MTRRLARIRKPCPMLGADLVRDEVLKVPEVAVPDAEFGARNRGIVVVFGAGAAIRAGARQDTRHLLERKAGADDPRAVAADPECQRPRRFARLGPDRQPA